MQVDSKLLEIMFKLQILPDKGNTDFLLTEFEGRNKSKG